jgi:hypothetical protein
MRAPTREFFHKLAAAKHAVAKGKVIEVKDDDTGQRFVYSEKRRRPWQLAPMYRHHERSERSLPAQGSSA